MSIDEEDMRILKGVYINRYYQLLSVANMKGVIACINSAASKILSKSRGNNTAGVRVNAKCLRAHATIGAALRNMNSAIAVTTV